MVLRLNSGRASALATPLQDGRTPSPPSPPLPPAAPGWANKVEQAITSGMRDLTDPAFLLPMVAAQGVFGLSRLGLFKILPQGISKGAAVAGANLGAFALEGLAFVGTGRGLRQVMGRETIQETGFAAELAHTYLTLGLLKTLGGLTQRGLQLRYQKVAADALSWEDRFILKSAPQAAQFAGIYLSHSLAPALGWGESLDPADRAFQSAVALLHFGAAGHVLGKIPGFTRLNREISRETDRTLREGWQKVLTGNNGLPLESQPALLSATGRTSTPGRNFNPLDFTQVMMEADSPRGSSEVRTPPGSAPKLTQHDLGIRFPDRDPSIGELPTVKPAPAVGSSREGIRRSQARGLDQHALAFLRMAGNELRDFPELRRNFFAHVRNILKFTTTLQEALDPILKDFPERNFAHLNQSRAQFDDALARLAPESGKNLAEAILFLASTKDLTTEASYRQLTDDQLVALGLEPMARNSFRRHAHAFTSQEMGRFLDHPLLRDLPETQKLREAYQIYDQALKDFGPTVQQISEEIRQINKALKATTNAQRQFELESKKEAASGKIAAPYWRMVAKLNNAMETFLKDTTRANILHVRIAREAHLIRGIQDAHPRVMAEYLEKKLETLTGSARDAAQAYLRAYRFHQVFDAPGFKTLLKGLALFQPINLPTLTRGALDRATLGLIREIPTEFWSWERDHGVHLQEAQEAGRRFFQEQREITQTLREKFSELEELNDQFWSSHDKQAQALNAADVRFQMQQAQSYIEAGRKAMPESLFERRFTRRYEEGMKVTQEAIESYEKLVESGSHARRINRALEVAAERAKTNLTDLARKVLEAARVHGAKNVPEPQFQSLSALMMPYVDKINSHWHSRPGENLSIILRHALPTVGQSLRLIKRIWMKESSSQIDGILLQYNRRRHVSEGSRWVVDPNVARWVAAEPIVMDGKHDSWDDFLRGGTPNARSAQLQNGKQNHTHRDCPRIGAKAGLGQKVPVAGKAIDLLTVPISDSAIEYDGAVTHMGRAMAFGDMPAGRLGPRSSAVYSELTMPVSSLVGPYVWDPFPSQSTILAPPLGGRSFTIADRAMALTGRAQNLLLTTTLNAYRLWPKPDSPLPLRRGPLTTTTEFWPMMALTEVTDSMLRFQRPGKPTRANWLRTLWLLEAAKPEYQLPVPSVEKIFEPYRNPTDPELEGQIADMFNGAVEVYPTRESLRTLEREHAEILAQIRELKENHRGIPEAIAQKENFLTEGLDRQTHQLLETHLGVLEQKLEQELTRHPDIVEAKTLQRRLEMIRGRLEAIAPIGKKFSTGKPLNDSERKMLDRALAYYSGKTTPEAQDPLIDQLEFYFSHRDPGRSPSVFNYAHPEAKMILGGLETLIHHISSSGGVYREEILSLLKGRQQKAIRAFSNHSLGIPLTPVEQVLLEDLSGAFTRKPDEKNDGSLISALLKNHINDETIRKLLKIESIRENSRTLIEKLPGGGRGTLDPIAESADDAGRVMFTAARDVVAGPRSHWATAKYAGIFATYASALGVLGALDWVTGGKFDFYTMASPGIARHAQSMAGWRPVLSPKDVRVIEDIRIEAEGLANGPPRPIALAANHASWTDITTLMAVFPKMRFAFKEELMKVPFLNLALFFGRHQKVSRPKNNSPEERERAFRQVKNSGDQMVKTGLSPTFFHSGTRSLTGVPGSPKDGIAHLAMPTNALILATSILGTRQIMGDAVPTLQNGMGTGRRIYVGFDRVDPREIVDLDQVLEHRNSPKVMVKAGKEISGRIHEQITARFMEQLDDLAALARGGDAMAQAQLAEQLSALQPGMDLVRDGNEAAGKAWAKDHKTDFEVLKKVTEWWQRRTAVAE